MARELQERLLGETKLKSHPDSFPKFRLLDTPAEEGLREVALHFSHLLRYNGLIILWGVTLSGAKLMDGFTTKHNPDGANNQIERSIV